MSLIDSYSYVSTTRGIRDWLRTQTALTTIGNPPLGQRIYASALPRGVEMPAIAFHRMPGGNVDWTIENAQYQFDCYAPNPGADSALGGPELAEQIAAALATLLMSTPPRTRLNPSLVLEGAAYLDSYYLPDKNVPRQVVVARLSLASF